jgi:hypothetical protein
MKKISKFISLSLSLIIILFMFTTVASAEAFGYEHNEIDCTGHIDHGSEVAEEANTDSDACKFCLSPDVVYTWTGDVSMVGGFPMYKHKATCLHCGSTWTEWF